MEEIFTCKLQAQIELEIILRNCFSPSCIREFSLGPPDEEDFDEI